jgi:hypothetical protein
MADKMEVQKTEAQALETTLTNVDACLDKIDLNGPTGTLITCIEEARTMLSQALDQAYRMAMRREIGGEEPVTDINPDAARAIARGQESVGAEEPEQEKVAPTPRRVRRAAQQEQQEQAETPAQPDTTTPLPAT